MKLFTENINIAKKEQDHFKGEEEEEEDLGCYEGLLVLLLVLVVLILLWVQYR